VYQGFDINVVERFGRRGAFVQGGINAQKRVYDTCNSPVESAVPGITALVFATATQQVDNPESRYCRQTYPFRPDLKIATSYPLIWDVSISGTYQFSQGPNILSQWAVPNSIISAPGALGRNLASGITGTKTVQLVEPGTMYGDPLHQLDLRLSKRFKLETLRFRVDADLYNVFNSNWPFTLNNTFSTAATSQWLRPTNVLQGRLFKIGGQFDF
jgi:hypothetical protein